MNIVKPGESLKQCKDRLCRARAQAIRSGQAHHKLDAKIEHVNNLIAMKSMTTESSKPSPSKYASHCKRFSRPVQGGKVSPK